MTTIVKNMAAERQQRSNSGERACILSSSRREVERGRETERERDRQTGAHTHACTRKHTRDRKTEREIGDSVAFDTSKPTNCGPSSQIHRQPLGPF